MCRAGLRFPALGGLSLEGRYVYGLTDLNLSTVSTTESYRTRSLLLLLGKRFSLARGGSCRRQPPDNRRYRWAAGTTFSMRPIPLSVSR